MSELVTRGPNVVLRYATAADAPAFFALARDPEVTTTFSWSYEREEQAAEWVAGLPALRESGELLDFAIEHASLGVVGSTGLNELAARDRRAMVGTWLGREHWGSGANAESKALIAALAFGPVGLERLGAYASTANPRSQRALERQGFVREGILRAFHRRPDRVHDIVVYSLLRSDWEAGPLHEVPVTIEGEPPEAWRLATGPNPASAPS